MSYWTEKAAPDAVGAPTPAAVAGWRTVRADQIEAERWVVSEQNLVWKWVMDGAEMGVEQWKRWTAQVLRVAMWVQSVEPDDRAVVLWVAPSGGYPARKIRIPKRDEVLMEVLAGAEQLG